MTKLDPKLLLGPELGNVVRNAFHRMEIAEEEIKTAKSGASPKAAARVHDVFKYLVPGPALRPLSDDVYRSHARELCQRARRGQDLAEPTDAECLAVLMSTSGIAPLTQDGAALAEILFERVVGKPVPGTEGPRTRESYPGACDELLISLRRKTKATNPRPWYQPENDQ